MNPYLQAMLRRVGGRSPLLDYQALPFSRYADDPIVFSKRGFEDAIARPDPRITTYAGGSPDFENTAPRIELDDELRRGQSLNAQAANGFGFTGNDISLSGTNWELTPQQMLELRDRDEAKRAAAQAAPRYGPLGPMRPAGEISNDPLTMLLRYLGVGR